MSEGPSKLKAHPDQSRNFRQVFLVVILILVGGAFAYDKLIATRQWKSAWEEIKAIDASNMAGATTSVDVQRALGRQPSESYSPADHKKMVVETYRWRRGLVLTTHDIHVVYSKAVNKGDDTTKLFYYSASAGNPPNNKNFPKKTVVSVNLNPPGFGRGGGPPRDAPSGGGNRRRQRPSPDADSDSDDKNQNGK